MQSLIEILHRGLRGTDFKKLVILQFFSLENGMASYLMKFQIPLPAYFLYHVLLNEQF